MDTKKKVIDEEIFNKISYDKPIKFGEIEVELQPDDVIIHEFEENYNGSDSGMDAHWSLSVYRERLETDEEYERRKDANKNMETILKKRRYEQYLNLKKEFENE